MNEEMLWAYRQQEEAFVQWVAQQQQIVDRVTKALVTLHRLDGSPRLADLIACRDAAQTLQMVAHSGGFEDVAALFRMQYDHFCRAVLLSSDELD